MSENKLLPVKDLSIDLYNFRAVPQDDEIAAIQSMISISPDFFWGLMESLLDDGYLPTENIIILKDHLGKMTVKEGNRRIASLKIILKIIDERYFDLPTQISDRIEKLDTNWISENSSLPCTVYSEQENSVVDRIVARTHGKGSKAGRDAWEAVARARHNRDKNGAVEPALDLLEKYLEHGNNFTNDQKIRWSGRYNLSVLDEAIKKISTRFEVSSSVELSKRYPNIKFRKPLDDIMYSIGVESLGFSAIRNSNDFSLRFGVPTVASTSEGMGSVGNGATRPSGRNTGNPQSNNGGSGILPGSSQGAPSLSTGNANNAIPPIGAGIGSNNSSVTPGKTQAVATTDERSVKRMLKSLKIYGLNRSKLDTIRKECCKLKLQENPIAFCFLLRSMFELSAKAYCQDHSGEAGAPVYAKSNGNDRPLADILRDIVSYLTQNDTDVQMVRILHGPFTEIQRKDGILSVTSMNQLVHNISFTLVPSDIPVLFSNIFPLLEQMNK